MSFLAFIKNEKKVKNNFMPAKYPASRVSYDDNGTETNVQAKVSELNADITKNDLSSSINISGYTSSSDPYTVPSEGYVRGYAETNGKIVLQIMGGTNGVFSLITNCLTASETSNALYVKKGMRVYVREKSGTASAYFYAIN